MGRAVILIGAARAGESGRYVGNRRDGDPVRLTQVFYNLLDNASKYTPDGGEIALAAAADDHAVIITVFDNGAGITAKALPDIFDLFVQRRRDLPLHNRRLGIGLAVVRDLVEAHDGTVVARSAGKDRDSEFTVTLPMADGPATGSTP
jgi:signal transduction histidine kinase